MKKNNTYVSFLMLLLFIAFESFAVNNIQDIVITGTVTDAENNEVIAGANIVIKGTTKGTITDLDGNYSLEVSEDAILVISFIGYQTQEISVSGQATLNILLVPSAEQLNDVIVIAYGTTTRSNLTGSAIALNDEDLKDVFAPNISTFP